MPAQTDNQLSLLQDKVERQSAELADFGSQVRKHQLELVAKDKEMSVLRANRPETSASHGSASQDLGAMCAAHKQEKAALQATHEQEQAALQAAHQQEITAFRAQAAQAKAEYMQVLNEKQKLQDTIYDLEVSGAAH